MSKSPEDKIRHILKGEAIKRAPKTDPNALKKIKKKTRGKK